MTVGSRDGDADPDPELHPGDGGGTQGPQVDRAPVAVRSSSLGNGAPTAK